MFWFYIVLVALDADWHYGYCSACGHFVKEGHGAYWDETTIPYCTRCGYVA